MISVALQTADRYASVSLLCITVWLVGQALINIGVVVGVSPSWACRCRSSRRAGRP